MPDPDPKPELSEETLAELYEAVKYGLAPDSKWRYNTVIIQLIEALRAARQELDELRESFRTPSACGHMQNFLIGDEHGHFTCTMCRIAELEQQLDEARRTIQPAQATATVAMREQAERDRERIAELEILVKDSAKYLDQSDIQLWFDSADRYVAGNVLRAALAKESKNP